MNAALWNSPWNSERDLASKNKQLLGSYLPIYRDVLTR
jgi:hypothetical protein